MWEVHSSDKIRIKDIAERSGVSVGTVDRVLHNRPNVSGKARAKVEAVLKEINYQPNMYASALAYNRKYTFCCLHPITTEMLIGPTWKKVCSSVSLTGGDFHLSLITEHYDQFEGSSFAAAAERIWDKKPDRGGHCPTEFRCDSGILPPVAGTGHSLCFSGFQCSRDRAVGFLRTRLLEERLFCRAHLHDAGRRTRPTYFC